MLEYCLIFLEQVLRCEGIWKGIWEGIGEEIGEGIGDVFLFLLNKHKLLAIIFISK